MTPVRVAFTLFGGHGWTGGINYLRNLISALSEIPGKPVTPVLFVAPDTPSALLNEILPYLSEPPVAVPGWSSAPISRLRRLWFSAVLQNDRVSLEMFQRQQIDVVFVHAAWYGIRFSLPTLAWIADFQHRHLPKMFSLANRLRRDLGYAALSRCATAIMLSSQDARGDCEHFYPRSRGKTFVLPFAVRIDAKDTLTDPEVVVRRYALPRRYFFLPNQLWKHKNHLNLLQALSILKERGSQIVVVASGNPVDSRNPRHPESVLDMARKLGLAESFRFLGLVPYCDLIALMRASLAVVNPSLFEGWSTTVEEAKALGVPLLLSDLEVHREQTKGVEALYFNPHLPPAIADTLDYAWQNMAAHRADREAAAVQRYADDRAHFAASFAEKVASLRALRHPQT